MRMIRGQQICRDVATNKQIASWPHQRDCFEEDKIEIRKSLIQSDIAGEGVFAKRDLKAGELVAIYNGVRYQTKRNDNRHCKGNEDWDYSEYSIRLNGQINLDIPPEMSSPKNYSATLGHKVNHSFKPNGKWFQLDHPRFGLICAVKAIMDVPCGSEILVDYGIDMSFAPEWYKALWVKHCREELKWTDAEIRDWCGKKYAITGRYIELPLLSRETA